MSEERNGKKPFYKKWWFIVLGVVVVLGIAAAAGGKNKSDTIRAIEGASFDPLNLIDGKRVEFQTGDFKQPMYLFFNDGDVQYVSYDRTGIIGNIATYKRYGVERGSYEVVGSPHGFLVKIKCSLGPSVMEIDTTFGDTPKFMVRWGDAQNPNRMYPAAGMDSVGDVDAWTNTSSSRQIQWK